MNNNKKIKTNNDNIMDDDQLVGFVPYVVYKALGRKSKDMLKLTKVLTNNKEYDILFEVLDNINKENIMMILLLKMYMSYLVQLM